MPVESSVTQISDLNELWPLDSDIRRHGSTHLRLLKVAVKSLLTNPGQLSLPSAPTFVDGETVTVTPSSAALTLAYTPSPAASLILVRNGIVLRQGTDYIITGASVTLTTAIAADGNEWIRAWYRR